MSDPETKDTAIDNTDSQLLSKLLLDGFSVDVPHHLMICGSCKDLAIHVSFLPFLGIPFAVPEKTRFLRVNTWEREYICTKYRVNAIVTLG